MESSSEEWVEIGATNHSDEAVAWRDLLRSTGIFARLVPDVDLVDVYPGTNIQGPFRLYVHANIESEARDALNDIRNPAENAEETD